MKALPLNKNIDFILQRHINGLENAEKEYFGLFWLIADF